MSLLTRKKCCCGTPGTGTDPTIGCGRCVTSFTLNWTSEYYQFSFSEWGYRLKQDFTGRAWWEPYGIYSHEKKTMSFSIPMVQTSPNACEWEGALTRAAPRLLDKGAPMMHDGDPYVYPAYPTGNPTEYPEDETYFVSARAFINPKTHPGGGGGFGGGPLLDATGRPIWRPDTTVTAYVQYRTNRVWPAISNAANLVTNYGVEEIDNECSLIGIQFDLPGPVQINSRDGNGTPLTYSCTNYSIS